MRIVASADFHGDLALYHWLVGVAAHTKPDVLVMAGDLLGAPDVVGTLEEDQRANALEIVKTISPVSQPVLYLMGNDDAIELEPQTDSIRSINGSRIEVGDLNFVGYQYSLPFMGGIFEKPEDGILDDLSLLSALVDERSVLVTHSPAYGILDTGILGRLAGSQSIKALVEDRNPLLHIHGYIHGEFGVQGRHFNVAAGGNKRAVLIDTDTLAYQVLSGESA